jgi:hypothetical protein
MERKEVIVNSFLALSVLSLSTVVAYGFYLSGY